MPSRHASHLSLLSLLNSLVLALPTEAFQKLQCHCITFYTSSSPAPCTLSGAQNLDWETARSLASTHNLKIQFASQTTMSEVLAAEKPLPTGVLMAMHEPEEIDVAGTRIVCGAGDEVRKKYFPESYEGMGGVLYDAYVSGVMAALLLFIILYALGEYIWMRSFAHRGRIRLEGKEKVLTVATEQEPTTSSESKDG